LIGLVTQIPPLLPLSLPSPTVLWLYHLTVRFAIAVPFCVPTARDTCLHCVHHAPRAVVFASPAWHSAGTLQIAAVSCPVPPGYVCNAAPATDCPERRSAPKMPRSLPSLLPRCPAHCPLCSQDAPLIFLCSLLSNVRYLSCVPPTHSCNFMSVPPKFLVYRNKTKTESASKLYRPRECRNGSPTVVKLFSRLEQLLFSFK
jgi:hypothetical protein